MSHRYYIVCDGCGHDMAVDSQSWACPVCKLDNWTAERHSRYIDWLLGEIDASRRPWTPQPGDQPSGMAFA